MPSDLLQCPGVGTTTADEVYKILAPRTGEQADSPWETTYPQAEVPLEQRLRDVCDDRSERQFAILLDERTPGSEFIYHSYRFPDGSVLTFVERPLGDESAGTALDAVELIRP
jgi:hypothetical protein